MRHPNRSYRFCRTPRWVFIVALVAMLFLPALAVGAPLQGHASPDPPLCLGKTIAEWQAAGYSPIVGNRTINGSWRDDVIIVIPGPGGVAVDTVVNAGNGDDVVCGGAGNDTINGGPGFNVMVGGEGNDRIVGGPNIDYIVGDDVINGAPGPAPVRAQRPPGWYQGTSAVEGDPYNGRIYLLGWWYDCAETGGDDDLDEMAGGGGEISNGSPALWGCAGNDRLRGRDGDEHLFGGDGDDTLIGDEGNDRLSGGPGLDTCDGGQHQGAVNKVNPAWRAEDSDDGTCETLIGVP